MDNENIYLDSQPKTFDTLSRRIFDCSAKEIVSLQWRSPSIDCSLVYCDKVSALIVDRKTCEMILNTKSTETNCVSSRVMLTNVFDAVSTPFGFVAFTPDIDDTKYIRLLKLSE